VKRTFSFVSLTAFALTAIVLTTVAGILTFRTPGAAAQPFMSGNQQRPAPQAAPAQPDGGEGMGMMNGGPMMGGQGMMGGQNMMGARQMHGMPMMPACGNGMMGPGPMMGMEPMMGRMMMRGMMGSAKDLKTVARMMEMRADMLKASAEVMEKYAKDMDAGK
jgi:hypothetical protein